MRKTLIVIFLAICFIGKSQTHVEYVSEPTDSMALINKKDIDVINNVFNERNVLDSLHNINEQLLSNMELELKIQDSIISNQVLIISNSNQIIADLEDQNLQNIEKYTKDLKKEKNKKISFQTLTGASIVVIILLILL